MSNRRTFAIISHPDAGKTTLTEKLLLQGGAIHLAGEVKARGQARRARSDWMKIEQQRGISVTSSVMTFEKDGITDLHVAFSRKEKKLVYVQDVLRAQRDPVWALVEKGAKIFVCGDGGHMEPDVRRALALMYREETDCSEDEADAWLSGLMRDGRYVLDVWVSD